MQNKNGVDLIKVSLTRFQLASSFNFDGTRLGSRSRESVGIGENKLDSLGVKVCQINS